VILASMAASGALAGMVGVNEIAGVHGRLLPDFVAAPASPALRWA